MADLVPRFVVSVEPVRSRRWESRDHRPMREPSTRYLCAVRPVEWSEEAEDAFEFARRSEAEAWAEQYEGAAVREWLLPAVSP
jgi:hypothetical protein